ncbi:Spy0128 family protein [Collinsella aerofaciens]|uniref:Spy0128 family protein n=1 Tax=Collinsella aerofaciens TaxID=74426 RepID=UPI0018984279|nr:FctA domain-containing protein [Collinsella aerofaciens]MDB1863056.1 FctA domain-containing protein [Collinsella aerofaciens]
MKANSDKSKQSKKATRRVLAGVLCGASVLSLVLSLVMPPISQAIANDAQAAPTEETVMGGGSSSESTDVENTNNGDTENQNSDDAEADETGSSNDVEQNQAEDQPEGTLQVEDNEPADGNAVMAATEGEQTEAAPDEIKNVDDLKTKLANASGVASFKLMNDVETGETITLSKDGSKITLDLNGHKIKHTSSNQPLFNITGGATLTVKDGQQAAAKEIQANQENKCGNLASMEYGDSNIPTKLTYYVTESVASGTVTNETLKAYEAGIKGAIVACSDTKAPGLRLVNLFNGGHFNFESGVLTQKKDGQIGNLIYAENGSTVNMSGGYVCGASGSGDGAGIMVSNEKGVASTLKLTGGVIAGNSAYSGGGVYARYSEVTITNGIISGNSTLNAGLGGGIMAKGGIVTVSGGYITNNRMVQFCGHDGWGDHGGAGLAANNGAHVTISGGQITGNYSEEAGGGVYVTDVERNDQASRLGMAWLNITGGIIASNVSYRSEGAGIRVGQMVDAMINGTEESKVYITNNHCMSRFDWGGGGIFVQGNSNAGKEYTAGRLFVYNSYISSNTAGGYGGGVAVCPTGKTLVTNTDGTAIFGNISAGDEQNADGDEQNANGYDPATNSGNEGKPHLSSGGSEKNQDQDAYNSEKFRKNGHADFFLAAKDGHKEPLAAIIGKMLGGGDAKYLGSKELNEAIKIPADGGVQIYRSIGLTSDVHVGDAEANNAQAAATTFITGNYSWDHGGGIMSNGDLYLGVPADTYVYPSLKLKASKALKNKQTEKEEMLTKDQFSFAVYRKDSDTATAPSWKNDSFSDGDCTLVGSAKNDAEGNITFDLGEQFVDKTVVANKITYYLVEQTGGDSDIEYDHTVYEIEVQLTDNETLLMNVPKKDDSSQNVPLYVHNYTITSVSATGRSGDTTKALGTMERDSEGYYSIIDSNAGKTFTNKYTPYTSSGSWTPKATKVVKGGEMKEFTLEFADNLAFEKAKTVKTQIDGDKTQTLPFEAVNYELKQLEGGGTTGRGASKTFTYYVREKDESSLFSHYKFDKSVYKLTVVATDNTKGTINRKVTYRKGTVGSDGKWKDADGADHELTDTDTPTFTNTYSTSLPLSGMSGITLTYLAGAAVLCAAAAWMHIRRKANAKGGERRE